MIDLIARLIPGKPAGAAQDTSSTAPDGLLRLGGGVILVLIAAYALYSAPGLLNRWGGVTVAGVAVALLWAGLAAFALPIMRGRLSMHSIALLFAAALLARVIVALLYAGRALGGDAHFYPLIAGSLLRGAGLQVYEPFIGQTMRALYPPLYPLLLAGWGAIAGMSTPSLALMNLVVDGAAACMIARLGIRIKRRGAGFAAAWLYLIWPSVLLSSPVAQKEGLIALLVIALAGAWIGLRDEARWPAMLATGVLSGLLALTQPGLAPLSGLMGICLFVRHPRSLIRCALPAAGVACLVMLPWWIRNWTLFHAFVPLTSSAQISLWIGNNAGATGNWMPPPPALRGMPELAYAKAAGAMARDWIAGHPIDFARLTVEKLLRATGTAQAETARLAWAHPPPSNAVTNALFSASEAAHIMLLEASAIALMMRRRWRLPEGLGALLVACGAQLVLFSVWFEFGERHRQFALPFLILLVSAAVARPAQRYADDPVATAP